MATSAERKALVFLAAVVCLGAGARIARSRGDAALAAAGGRGAGGRDDGHDALAAQISAVDRARAGLPGPAGARPARRSKSAGRAHRSAVGDSTAADSAAADSTPRPRARRSRARSPGSDPAVSPSATVDGWAQRPVETRLAPGGFGVVRGGIAPPSPDSAPAPTRRRRKRPR